MTDFYGKEEIYRLLEETQIPYRKKEHAAVYTMEEILENGLDDSGTICKNLFLRDAKGRKHYLVSVAGDKKVDLKRLAEQIGSTRLSFASAERLRKYLGVEQGCVSPLGVLNDSERAVTVVLDEDLQKQSEIGVHPNDNTASVWISFQDLCRILNEHGNEVLLVKVE